MLEAESSMVQMCAGRTLRVKLECSPMVWAVHLWAVPAWDCSDNFVFKPLGIQKLRIWLGKGGVSN